MDEKRLPMGVLEFTHEVKDGSWTTEFQTPRVHARWRLVEKGDEMERTMALWHHGYGVSQGHPAPGGSCRGGRRKQTWEVRDNGAASVRGSEGARG